MKKHIMLTVIAFTSLISSMAHANSAQQPSKTEGYTCALYHVASQYAHSRHTESLHCQDKNGLSYELIGNSDQLEAQFQQFSQVIEQKLTDSIIQETDLNPKQQAQINTAKMRLRPLLKGTAKPQLKVVNFIHTSDQIIFTDQTEWFVFHDAENFAQKINALNVAQKSQLLAASGGVNERTVLAIHVTANDFSFTDTPEVLSDSVFGTDGDPVNLTSQYDVCSYSQMKLIPATGQHITNGVVEITIDMDVDGRTRGAVSNAVIAATNELIGSLNDITDHYMIALPPNTTTSSGGGWIAFAGINGTYSIYNNHWAKSVSAQMHELAHNFGMGHSGNGNNEYGDNSGYMGSSSSSSNSPKKCFNSAKSSKFGWYENQELTFFESDWSPAQNFWRGQIVGISDYDQADINQDALIKIHSIEGNVSSSSLNINFNRQAGFNSGTNSGKNRLMVVSTELPTGYNQTWRKAILDAGESAVFENFWSNEKDLVITVLGIETDNNDVRYADVEISVNFNLDDLIFTDGFDN